MYNKRRRRGGGGGINNIYVNLIKLVLRIIMILLQDVKVKIKSKLNETNYVNNIYIYKIICWIMFKQIYK